MCSSSRSVWSLAFSHDLLRSDSIFHARHGYRSPPRIARRPFLSAARDVQKADGSIHLTLVLQPRCLLVRCRPFLFSSFPLYTFSWAIMIPILFASLLAFGSGAVATPLKRQSAISASQIASYTPYAYYAAAAYCPSSTFPNWSCGCTHISLGLDRRFG